MSLTLKAQHLSLKQIIGLKQNILHKAELPINGQKKIRIIILISVRIC